MSKVFLYPITDRSKDDILLYNNMFQKGWKNFSDEEKELWSKGMKGALNTTDINRVQNNIEYLADLQGIDVTVTYIDSLFFTPDIEEEIQGNIETITGHLPRLPLNTFEKWNDIEQALKEKFVQLTMNGITHENAYRLAFEVGSEKGVVKDEN